jgi:hypothetical protein
VTFFLAAFLVLNIRQDPMVVMARRVKRFQVEFVQEFMESGDELRSERWSAELARRKATLSAQIRRGVGRLSEPRQQEVDDLITKSWEEILYILSARTPRARAQEESLDLKRIEGIIQRALSGGHVIVQAAAPALVAQAEGAAIAGGRAQDTRERADVAAAERQARVASVPREPGEAEAVEEAEEAEAVEEIGEAEAVEEPGEAEAVEEAEEAEAVEEIGEAEAVEEIGEAEAVEEAEEPGAAEPIEEAEAEAVLEEVPEAEPIAELEEAPSGVEPLPPEPEEDLELLTSADGEPFGTMETDIGAEEELEEVALEELGELEDATEADAVVEEAEEAPAEPIPAGEAEVLAQLRGLIRSGKMLIFEPAALAAAMEERQSSVVLENGVYRIREDLYRSAGPEKPEGTQPVDRDGELQELALSVMAPGGEREGAKEEPAGVSGIGDILGGVEGIDLLDEAEIEEIRTEARVPDRGERRAKRLGFTGSDVDLDGYLRQFADPEFEPTQFRALVEVSRRVQAVAAAVLVESGGAFRAQFSIGLAESGPGRFAFASAGAVGTEVLSGRRGAVVNEGLDAIAAFSDKASPEDLRFMKRAALLPALFRGQAGFLFLAFAEERDWDLKALLEGLDIG